MKRFYKAKVFSFDQAEWIKMLAYIPADWVTLEVPPLRNMAIISYKGRKQLSTLRESTAFERYCLGD